MPVSEYIDKQTFIDQLREYRRTACVTEDSSKPSNLNEFN